MSVMEDNVASSLPEGSLFPAEESMESQGQSDPRGAFLEWAMQHSRALREDPDIDMDDADLRFSSVLPMRRVRSMSVAIVGAGGLGNFQWKALLGMGFRRVSVFDDDVVNVENIGSQGHSEHNLGLPKVEAIRQEALLYRGVDIPVFRKRVYSLAEIDDALGYTPDIVITCTDSAEFREKFFKSFTSTLGTSVRLLNGVIRADRLPLLWLDYRMSLGDWVCYALPLRSMTGSESVRRISANFLNAYRDEAIFSESEAVHDSCTAKGIIYVGFNVASYTGAYLDWFINTFEPALEEAPYETLKNYLEGNMDQEPKMAFSARDFKYIHGTRTENILRRELAEARKKAAELEEVLEARLKADLEHAEQAAAQAAEQRSAEEEQEEQETARPDDRHTWYAPSVSWGDLQVGDMVLFPALGEDMCTVKELHMDMGYVVVRFEGDAVDVRVNSMYGSDIQLFGRGGNGVFTA